MVATQINREARVKTALGDDVLLFASMRASEALGRPFELEVVMVSTDNAVKIADVLGTALTVSIMAGDGGEERHFNGIVTHFRHAGWDHSRGAPSYQAIVRPALMLLSYASNCRVFQDMSVVQIVKQVCSAYGGDLLLSDTALEATYAALPYCVQYRETDLDFVLRLLEGAGIYFYFSHAESSHTMVLADSYGAHQPFPGYEKLQYREPDSNGVREHEVVYAWQAGGAITSSRYVLNDYDFEKSGSSLGGGLVATTNLAAPFGQTQYEMYDYPGNYSTASAGTAATRARIESLHGRGELILAASDARGLHAGGLFTLAEHPRDDQNRDFLVTSATSTCSNNDYASNGRAFEFSCEFSAIGKEHPYRPARTMRRPVIAGPQTAIVVGKAGEEIWTDKYGRIKIQFHWDRLGKDDENSSCWVRVAQGWAGKGWGAMSIPRIGMEVVVSFLEGDPDRPLVTGCVYNSDAMPPYPLPAEQTMSTLKSQSSKGGAGFNELRFEDMKGEEEIYVHAERDFLRVVKNNDALKVGFETAEKGDQTIDIKNDQALTIGNDQAVAITNDQTVKIDGKQAVKVGSTIVIEAGTSIELKVGGSSIKIEGSKITIKSAEIEIAADANAKVKAGAMMEIKSGAPMTIAGAIVQIN